MANCIPVRRRNLGLRRGVGLYVVHPLIWLGIFLLILGAFMASQNTASKVASPLMVAGVVLLILSVIGVR